MLVSIVGYHFLKQPSLKQYQMCHNDFRLWIVKWAPSFSEGSKNFLLVYVVNPAVGGNPKAYSKYSTVLRNSQCSLGHFVADPAEGSNFAHLRISMAIWLKVPLSVSQQDPCFPMAWELTWKHASKNSKFWPYRKLFNVIYASKLLSRALRCSMSWGILHCSIPEKLLAVKAWQHHGIGACLFFSPANFWQDLSMLKIIPYSFFTLLGAFLFIPFTAMVNICKWGILIMTQINMQFLLDVFPMKKTSI